MGVEVGGSPRRPFFFEALNSSSPEIATNSKYALKGSYRPVARSTTGLAAGRPRRAAPARSISALRPIKKVEKKACNRTQKMR